MLPRCTYLLLFLILTAALFPVLLWSQAGQNVAVSVQSRLPLCQDSADNDGDFLVDYSADPQCSSALDDNENVSGMETHATNDFTVGGGDFSFTNGDGLAVDFSFPADFYTEAVRLYANSYANDFFESSGGYIADVGGTSPRPRPSGKEFVGKTYDFILFVVSSETRLTSPINKAVTITLRYQDGDVPASTSENTITPYAWSESAGDWQALSGATLNTANNTVEFSVSDFSGGSFALFAAPAAEEEAVPSAPLPGQFTLPVPVIKVPPKAPPEIPAEACAIADFNCDSKVNIRDLSILLYFWTQPYEIAEPYDLNEDGKIDIRDVSILLYYWTG